MRGFALCYGFSRMAYRLWRQAGLFSLFGWLLVLPVSVPAAEDGELENKVKAAYLYHLIRFVEWPRPPQSGTMRLCIVGAPDMGNLLGELSNRQVQQDVLLSIESGDAIDPSRCQMLFIGRADTRNDWLQRLRGKSVLTVSDRDNFASQGGMIGFYRDNRKIRLEINPDALRTANLRASSKLLEIARSVATDR